LTAGVFAAAVAFGGSAVGHPAITTAAPITNSWDLEAFDDCLRKIDTTVYPGSKRLQDQSVHDDIKKCCWNSGGVWGLGDTC
jgi:hypothetical protein